MTRGVPMTTAQTDRMIVGQKRRRMLEAAGLETEEKRMAALTTRIAELEAALRPFDAHYPVTEGMRDHDPIACSLRVADLRLVRAALRGKEEE